MKKIIKISSAVCVALLAVLGFSACEPVVKYGMPEPMPKYGVPQNESISEKATGKVVDDTAVTVDENNITLTPKN